MFLHKQDVSMKHTLGECDVRGVLLCVSVVSTTDSHRDGAPSVHITLILFVVILIVKRKILHHSEQIATSNNGQ